MYILSDHVPVMSFESYSLPLEQKIKQKECNRKEKEAKAKKNNWIFGICIVFCMVRLFVSYPSPPFFLLFTFYRFVLFSFVFFYLISRSSLRKHITIDGVWLPTFPLKFCHTKSFVKKGKKRNKYPLNKMLLKIILTALLARKGPSSFLFVCSFFRHGT
ncbi:uncharacterized protein PWA37_004137 [Arxiozyma heterogenica]|uniref:uncharacterized protein n=1 Tax=Arxiozyma heterogenica TaxID=278026 RepID=UPI002F0069D2